MCVLILHLEVRAHCFYYLMPTLKNVRLILICPSIPPSICYPLISLSLPPSLLPSICYPLKSFCLCLSLSLPYSVCHSVSLSPSLPPSFPPSFLPSICNPLKSLCLCLSLSLPYSVCHSVSLPPSLPPSFPPYVILLNLFVSVCLCPSLTLFATLSLSLPPSFLPFFLHYLYLSHFLPSFHQTSYVCDNEVSDADAGVKELAVDLKTFRLVTAGVLTSEKQKYLFNGIGHLLSAIFINSTQYLTKININGVKKM